MATSHKYKKRNRWEKEEMAAAIAAVREKRMGYLKAATQFNVPRSTLFRFVNNTDSPIETTQKPRLLQCLSNQTFPFIATPRGFPPRIATVQLIVSGWSLSAHAPSREVKIALLTSHVYICTHTILTSIFSIT